jgi:hypothetical protein
METIKKIYRDLTGPTTDADQWASFCDSVKAAGIEILAAGGNADPVNKSEGLRYLSRILRGALEMHVEYSDPMDPVLFNRTNERLKYGFDNPDNIYSTCTLNDQHRYEIRGNRGSVSYLSVNLSNSDTTGKMLLTGFVEAADLVTDAAGNFNLQLGGERQPHNWLPILPGTNTLMIRQSFLDRARETAARYDIRRISPRRITDAFTEAKARENLEHAEQWFCRTGRTMLGWANNLLPTMNELPPADQAYVQSLGADPRMYYYWSSWRLAPEEILLIHLPELPASGMWSLCLSNLWLESLDYTQYRINFNSVTAKQNPDGSVTLAIADQDPGIANWLNTSGHPQGNMMFRWTKADRIIHPRVRLVKRDAVNWESQMRRWTD